MAPQKFLKLNHTISFTITALFLSTFSSLYAADADKPYEQHVKCEQGKACQVDKFLIRGFRAFSQCQVCHGIDGNGSTIAPSLVQKLKEIDKVNFTEKVVNGYKGQIGVMPPWGGNPNVMKNLENLYVYLKARSDGVIPSGRLTRYDRGGPTVVEAPTGMSGMSGMSGGAIMNSQTGMAAMSGMGGGAAMSSQGGMAAMSGMSGHRAPVGGFGSRGNINR